MFFRFGAALSLIVLVALAGTALETQNLQLKRALSHQQYRLDAMLDSHVRLRLQTQRLGTPARLLGALESGEFPIRRPIESQRRDERRTPLLNWILPNPNDGNVSSDRDQR